jgi:hypothetical protein
VLVYEDDGVSIATHLLAAKRHFFRALRCCPWSKALWLDGILLLRRYMSPSELEGITELMGSSGIRLRAEDVLDGDEAA